MTGWGGREFGCTGAPVAHNAQPSWRKGAGIGAILLLIIVWAMLVASLARFVGRWPVLVQMGFYLIMGLVWIIPLKPLIRWSQTGRFRASSERRD
jgi:membrane protein YdbS with pleckstrin-like domain